MRRRQLRRMRGCKKDAYIDPPLRVSSHELLIIQRPNAQVSIRIVCGVTSKCSCNGPSEEGVARKHDPSAPLDRNVAKCASGQPLSLLDQFLGEFERNAAIAGWITRGAALAGKQLLAHLLLEGTNLLTNRCLGDAKPLRR